MSFVPACLSGITAPQISALIALHLHGEVERQRGHFVHPGRDRHLVITISALVKRELVNVSFRAGRHRARLNGKGEWYARTAVARWSEMLAA